MDDHEDQQAIIAMTAAIVTANRDDPLANTRADLIGVEVAEHYAKAALRGLKTGGFTIIRERRKPRPTTFPRTPS